jgi:hypothetical protein
MSDRRKEYEPRNGGGDSRPSDDRPGSAVISRPAVNPSMSPAASPAMSPGDQAPAGTPGTGENVCPVCGGSGRGREPTMRCPNCEGTGKVIVGIGGA